MAKNNDDFCVCPFCGSDNLYAIDKEEYIVQNNRIVDVIKVPAIFCNCCKTTTQIENDSPFIDNERTYNYLLEKLNNIWNLRKKGE